MGCRLVRGSWRAWYILLGLHTTAGSGRHRLILIRTALIRSLGYRLYRLLLPVVLDPRLPDQHQNQGQAGKQNQSLNIQNVVLSIRGVE